MKYLICVLVAMAAPIVMGALINKRSTEQICSTPGCIEAASAVLSSLDLDINPCDDFYQFACGKFIKNTIIPDDKLETGKTTLLEDKVNQQLNDALGEEIDAGEARAITLAKQFYASCMNKNRIDERDLEPMQNIHSSVGGWPVVEGESWKPVEWLDIFKKLYFLSTPFFVIEVVPDFKNSTQQTIMIAQQSSGTDLTDYAAGEKIESVDQMLEYMTNVATLFGADPEIALRDMTDVLFLEGNITMFMVPEEQQQNLSAMYNPTTIKELQQDFPKINWLELINSKFPEDLSVDETERVILLVPFEYIKSLETLLANTPDRTLANYLVWWNTDNSFYFLSDNARRHKSIYDSHQTGIKKQSPRWEECVEMTKQMLPVSVSALYVRKYFDVAAKLAVLNMVHHIRLQLKNTLETEEWMDDETRVIALRKLKNIEPLIAFPDELMADSKIDEKTKHFNDIDDGKYFEAAMQINAAEIHMSMREVRKPTDKKDWVFFATIGTATVNAAYVSMWNIIMVTAAILQGAFYSPNRPEYMNYGGIGSVIGHEITHGFDNQGSKFDDVGNMRDWIDEETQKAFIKRAQCLIEQYGNYTDPTTGMPLDAMLTLGENIADNGGVRQAYLAYKEFVKENGEEPKLLELDYTQDQMFWISHAQVWCTVSTANAIKMRISMDPHALERFRVIGSLSNMVEFANDFNCPDNSSMNPLKKCSVW